MKEEEKWNNILKNTIWNAQSVTHIEGVDGDASASESLNVRGRSIFLETTRSQVRFKTSCWHGGMVL